MSYYLRAPKGRSKWYLWETVYKDGKRERKAVPTEIYPHLGMNPDYSVEEARTRVSQLNKEKSIDRKKHAQAARNEKNIRLLKSVFLNEAENDQFVTFLREEIGIEQLHLNKMPVHWEKVQKLISTLKLLPTDFFYRRKSIYQWFTQERLSLSYTKKLIRILNLWGQHKSRLQGQDFVPVPSPKGVDAARIQESQQEARGRRGESSPLTPDMLTNMKDRLLALPGQYEWLFVSIWFGLRPAEINQLKDSKTFRVTFDRATKVDVLSIYQPKLVHISKDKRWKSIPIFLPQQKEALEMIRQGRLKRPLVKTVQKYSGDYSLTLYGGRKGFTDLMLGLNQNLEDIASWLGHRNIDTTWRHYKQKNVVRFNRVA